MKSKKRKIKRATYFNKVITVIFTVFTAVMLGNYIYEIAPYSSLFIVECLLVPFFVILSVYLLVLYCVKDYIKEQQDELQKMELKKILNSEKCFKDYVKLVEDSLNEAILETIKSEGVTFLKKRKWKNEKKWILYFSKNFNPHNTPIEVANTLVLSLRKYPPIVYKKQGEVDEAFNAKFSAIAVKKFLMHFSDNLNISYVDSDKLEYMLIDIKKSEISKAIKSSIVF